MNPHQSPDTLRPDNHELWLMVRKRLNQRPSIPMNQIAAELGVDPKAMVDWFLAFKEPRPLVAMRKAPDGWSPAAGERRYAEWQRNSCR